MLRARTCQKVKPEAVSAFNQTNKHLEVVEFFAPLKIPIMVEKPLASNYEEAKKIEVPFDLICSHCSQK